MGGEMNNIDHDLLVTLNANMGMLIKQQSDFIERTDKRITALEVRMNTSETKDSRDSERFQSISEQMQNTMKNGEKIEAAFGKIDELRTEVTTLKTENQNLKDDLKELKDEQVRNRNVSYTWNSINSLFASIAAYLGVKP